MFQVEVIIQAENVLLPSVMLQVYSLLQVFSYVLNKVTFTFLSQAVESLTVEECRVQVCRADSVKLADSLLEKGGAV